MSTNDAAEGGNECLATVGVPYIVILSRPHTLSSLCMLAVYFFQAADGIRDRNVTGVQTCALPISYFQARKWHDQIVLEEDGWGPWRVLNVRWRSEERRVGKECRSRCSTYHYN